MPPEHDESPEDRPDTPDPDIDAAFAQIIAGWDEKDTSPVPRWPVSEDIAQPTDDAPQDRSTGPSTGTPGPGSPDRRTPDTGPAGPGTPDPAAPNPGTPGPATPGPRDWDARAEPEEHYVPPEPPPLPRGDLISRLAWAAVLIGPAFLLFAGFFWKDADRLWLAIAGLAFIGGFVVLVMRLPSHRDDDSGDNGAVV